MKYSVKELASMLGVSKESIYIYMDILGIDKIYATSYIKVSYRDITLTKPVKRICINKPQADKIIKYKVDKIKRKTMIKYKTKSTIFNQYKKSKHFFFFSKHFLRDKNTV